jgi:hypothetical protein
MAFIGGGRKNERLEREQLRGLPATFTAKMARDAGISWEALYRLRDDEAIFELSRGLYRQADAGLVSSLDLLAVSARVPRGTICLVSALSYWDLTDEMPGIVDLAVPRGVNRPTISHPPTRVHVFDPSTFSLGRIQAPIGEEKIWVSDRERTIVDCFRSRTLRASPVSYGALRAYLALPGAKPGRLLDLARPLRVFTTLQRALEVLS